MQGAHGAYYMSDGSVVQAQHTAGSQPLYNSSTPMMHLPRMDSGKGMAPSPYTASLQNAVSINNSQVASGPGDRLIVDLPVPNQLSDHFDYREPAFQTLRYTACTCDPNRYSEKGYSLRLTGQPIEVLYICF
jgi:hypothetical protein